MSTYRVFLNIRWVSEQTPILFLQGLCHLPLLDRHQLSHILCSDNSCFSVHFFCPPTKEIFFFFFFKHEDYIIHSLQKHTSVMSFIVHYCKETREKMDSNMLHFCRGFSLPHFFITCKKSSATERIRDINKPILRNRENMTQGQVSTKQ